MSGTSHHRKSSCNHGSMPLPVRPCPLPCLFPVDLLAGSCRQVRLTLTYALGYKSVAVAGRATLSAARLEGGDLVGECVQVQGLPIVDLIA